jgi:CRP-like cAMP-binding protein
MTSEEKNTNNYWAFHQLKFYLENISIPSELIESITSLFKVKKYNIDSIFANQGEKTDKIGFVCTGCFYMFTTNIRGDLDVKEFIGSNSFILSTFNTNISLATIQSLTESIILEANYSEIIQLYKQNDKLEAISKKGIEDRISIICEQMNNLKNKTAKERYELFKHKYHELEPYIPQYLIASFLGITPTQLSRIRKKMP